MDIELLLDLAPYMALGVLYLVMRRRDRKKGLTRKD
tara:strand:+ start:71 stop:178 length:108 start_codon:yes stop_codon:yes gene_type:complete